MAFEKRYGLFMLCSLVCLLGSSHGSLLSAENLVKRPLDQARASANGGYDDPAETLRKNDDSHLRLYYKSNSPGRTISHELEHRFIKNPNNYQYNHRLSQEMVNNFQPALQSSPQFDNLNNFIDPRQFLLNQANMMPQQPNIYADRNKQTMLNLHYHGNSLDGLESSLNARPDFQQFNQPQLQNIGRNNLLRMMLMSSHQHQQQQQPAFFQQQYLNRLNQINNPYLSEQAKNENALQYKIVHLKFNIQPQHGRVLGQGLVETDNGAGPIMQARKFSLLPREYSELVKNLLNSQMSSQVGGSPVAAVGGHTSLIKKRQDDYDDSVSGLTDNDDGVEQQKRQDTDEAGYERNVDDSSPNLAYRSDSADEEKTNDAEMNSEMDSFKSLKRRSDSTGETVDSLDDPDADSNMDAQRQMLLRSDDDQELEDSLADNSD